MVAFRKFRGWFYTFIFMAVFLIAFVKIPYITAFYNPWVVGAAAMLIILTEYLTAEKMEPLDGVMDIMLIFAAVMCLL